MIVVERAPPLLTVQDAGRAGYRASGVPTSGAMDQWALAHANRVAENPEGAAALEWAIAGGALKFERECTIALAGAGVEAFLDDSPVVPNTAIHVTAGQTLTVRAFESGRFLYIAIRGGVDCPIVLGSRSTYLPATFGGIAGRRLARGDVISIGHAAITATGEVASRPSLPAPDYNSNVIRIIAATESSLTESFLDGVYTVSLASDRTGYRLEGDIPLESAYASVTSEPVCAGTIQLPPGGHPIVLMADSPTVGGYRIIGAVISRDLSVLAQSAPGRRLKFAHTSVGDAQRLARDVALTENHTS